jgi:arsenate reductase
MVHGYLKHFLGDTAQIYSAGIETHGLNKKAIEMMMEDNIDISTHSSNHIDEYKHIVFDYIITVCDHAQEHCPFIPGNGIRIHHNFTDPSKVKGTEIEINSAFRKTRDEIKNFCFNFSQQFNK